ncbi:MAG TPA: phosphomannomutase, partial [Alphaproteobacteria bacterium]|nr:phosphomannomutase [Alphaproteobacteria bacterium]
KFDLVPQILAHLHPRAAAENFVLDTIDGVRVTTADGWWLIRPSNTQSVLVARAESTTPEGLQRLTDMAKAEVKRIGYELKF